MKLKEQEFLMEVALLAAKRSEAQRLRVGAVVADISGNIIATGFNGTVKNFPNDGGEYKEYCAPYTHEDEYGHYKIVTDQDMMVHAEQNVIAHAARRGISINGGTIIGTHSPCMKCCSLLIQCGITEMIFNEKHHSFDKVEDTYGKYIILKHWNH